MNEVVSRTSGEVWQKAEQNMARRERGRLIKKRIIKFVSYPNIMVFVGGKWKLPSLKGN